jgi:transcriptional regulator with XRE-family HTH domain
MSPVEIQALRKKRAENLKALRSSKKISKAKLSRITGLSRHTIDKIEGGNDAWVIDSEIIYQEALKQTAI